MPEHVLKVEAWAFQLDEPVPPVVFHPSEAERAVQIADPTRRSRYLRARSALRRVLAMRLGGRPEDVAFEIAAHGKPKVAGCEFSISHSGPWLVVTISDTAVGVDIETHRTRKNAMDLAERFFSASDTNKLRAVEEMRRDHAFIRQWVAKEAALKCEGVGLALHLHKAQCLANEDGIHSVRWDEEEFSIHEFSLRDGTPGAIAWHGDGKARIAWRDAAEINVS